MTRKTIIAIGLRDIWPNFDFEYIQDGGRKIRFWLTEAGDRNSEIVTEEELDQLLG